MDFHDVITTRRSVRAYRADPIPEDLLNRVLDAARIAPSGNNRQPWKFVLVRDPALKGQLVALAHGQAFIAEAPIIVVACGRNIHYNRGSYMGDLSMIVDVAIAVDHLTLAARAEGLGTCWIGSFSNTSIKKLLGIPDEVDVVALTPLGYPERDGVFTSVSARKPLEEIVCEDAWE